MVRKRGRLRYVLGLIPIIAMTILENFGRSPSTAVVICQSHFCCLNKSFAEKLLLFFLSSWRTTDRSFFYTISSSFLVIVIETHFKLATNTVAFGRNFNFEKIRVRVLSWAEVIKKAEQILRVRLFFFSRKYVDIWFPEAGDVAFHLSTVIW